MAVIYKGKRVDAQRNKHRGFEEAKKADAAKKANERQSKHIKHNKVK